MRWKDLSKLSLLLSLLAAWTIMAGLEGAQPNWGAAPHIDLVVPNPAQAGDLIVVKGTGFGATQGTSQLLYDGAPLAVLSWSDGDLGARLPDPKPDGTYNVQVVVGGVGSNIVQHTIVTGASLWGSMIWGEDNWGN